MTSIEPQLVSEAWAEQVRRTGVAEIGEFTQAQLLAAGTRDCDPSIRPSTPTTFDQLDEAERAAQVDDAARHDPGDPEALRLIGSVNASPLFSGNWQNGPIPDEQGQDPGELAYLDGMELPDGSPGVLVGRVDTSSSRWRYAVHSPGDLSRRLAASLFTIKDPDAPEESIRIATAILALVWPRGRWETRPRQIRWLLTCPSSGSRAHLKTLRNFGAKRSERAWEGLVSEEELAGRLLELFEQCAREGGRRR